MGGGGCYVAEGGRNRFELCGGRRQSGKQGRRRGRRGAGREAGEAGETHRRLATMNTLLEQSRNFKKEHFITLI